MNIRNLIWKYLDLQKRLVSSFLERNPNSHDMKWLLDFPSSGGVEIDGDVWSFIRHGAGVRFYCDHEGRHTVVDVHDNFNNLNLVDSWRLMIFLESIGYPVGKDEVEVVLREMCSIGALKSMGSGRYEARRP